MSRILLGRGRKPDDWMSLSVSFGDVHIDFSGPAKFAGTVDRVIRECGANLVSAREVIP